MEKSNLLHEKRQSLRFHILSIVKLAGESGGVPLQVTNIQNISRGGLAFFAEREIPQGEMLRLYFLPKNRKNPVEVRGKVVRCALAPKNKNACEIGVQFLDVSEEAKLAIQELEASFLAKHKKA